MHIANIVSAYFVTELPNSFEERKNLNISYRSTNLGDDNIYIISCETLDSTANLIGDMRDDLNRTSEVITATLCS